MNRKKLLLEIIGIVVFASIIGFLYNAFSPKSLKIIPSDPSVAAVPDSVLFESIFDGNNNMENTVTYGQVERMLQDPRFQFIDARRPDQFADGHIGNAINIFPEESEDVRIPLIFSLPKDKILIVYCDGGACDLSHILTQELTTVFGFKEVFIYPGGWEEWVKNRK